MADPELLLRHPGGTTPLRVGNGILAAGVAEADGLFRGRSVFAVSSPTVLGLHRGALAPIEARSASFGILTVPDGEEAKRLAEAERLWEALAAGGGRRDSLVVAFGGGSVGDLAGFVAAAFLRGVDCVQIPTTLLAQVDASVGGKTGVDLAAGKNLVGAFHHPRLVLADTALLATLPPAELRSGLVEAIKMAALFDRPLLERIAGDLDRLLAGDAEALVPVVRRAVEIKAAVVERDPTEQGERQLLNYGHTLGHAIEAASGYTGIRHGEAVGWGILFANRLARLRGIDESALAPVDRLLERLALTPPPPLDGPRLLEFAARDKKARASGPTWILPDGRGGGERVVDLPAGAVAAEVEAFLGFVARIRANV